LVQCREGYRYQDAEGLGPNEEVYLVYELDEASLAAKDISLHGLVRYVLDAQDPGPVIRHGLHIGSVRMVAA